MRDSLVNQILHGNLLIAAPIALVAGLATIKTFVDDDRANQLAEVDAALLADYLPPSAYADPGFLQFLKLPTLTEKQE